MGKIENDARLGIYLKTMLDWVLQLKTMLDGSLAVQLKVEGACPKLWEFNRGGNITGITST